jgi:hypothetical protein
MNQKYYYKIDVPGRDGYSFMVVSNTELNEIQVLDKAFVQGLFNDDIDANYATIDNLINDYDIENFKNCTYEII